ncbi:hypothetical protein D3C81_1710380 [compost metagenome]
MWESSTSSSACAAVESLWSLKAITPIRRSTAGSTKVMQRAPSSCIWLMHSAGTALTPSPLATMRPMVESWWLSNATASLPCSAATFCSSSRRTAEGRCRAMKSSASNCAQLTSASSANGESVGTTATKRSRYSGWKRRPSVFSGSKPMPSSTRRWRTSSSTCSLITSCTVTLTFG